MAEVIDDYLLAKLSHIFFGRMLTVTGYLTIEISFSEL